MAIDQLPHRLSPEGPEYPFKDNAAEAVLRDVPLLQHATTVACHPKAPMAWMVCFGSQPSSELNSVRVELSELNIYVE